MYNIEVVKLLTIAYPSIRFYSSSASSTLADRFRLVAPDSGGESLDCVVVAGEVVGAVPAAAAATGMASFAGATSAVFFDFFFFFLVWELHVSKVNVFMRLLMGDIPPAIPKGA